MTKSSVKKSSAKAAKNPKAPQTPKASKAPGKRGKGQAPWKRPWMKGQGPVASIFRIGGVAAIQFEYSPARVKAIKGCTGARFSGDRKEWRVPLHHLPGLIGSRDFPKHQLLLGLSRQVELEINPLQEDAALQLLRSEPFLVSEDVIASVPLDLVVRFEPQKRRILAIPALASPAKKILEKFTGALYSGFDSAYSIPAERVADLLKQLRGERLIFGVEALAGAALKESAALRSECLAKPKRTSADELAAALLTPFVTRVWDEESSSYRYRPCYFTGEQFKSAFPGVKRGGGAKSFVAPEAQNGRRGDIKGDSKEEVENDTHWSPVDEGSSESTVRSPAAAFTPPFTLDEVGLLHLVGRFSTIPFTIWLTEDCHDVIERERTRLKGELAEIVGGALQDSLSDLIEAPAMWRVDTSGGAILQLATGGSASREQGGDHARGDTGEAEKNREGVPLPEMLYSLVAPLLGLLATPPERSVSLFIPDSKLVAIFHEVSTFVDSHDLEPLPQTERFIALLEDARTRISLRERAQIFTSLADVSEGELPELTPEAAAKLFPHQRTAVKWLLMTPYAFLGDDMGLGKTLSVLSYFAALKSSHGFELLVVVCPNSLTRNWLREVGQWYPNERGMVLSGDKAEKMWALRLLTGGTLSVDLLIINYEAMRLEYVTPEVAALCEGKRTLLCLDESQRVKNHASKTFKAIAEIAPLCERRVLLSGTPTPKDVTDLWAQMRLLDGGVRFGKSFYRWLEGIAELGNEFSDYGIKKFIPEAVEEAVLRVHEVMLRRKKEKVVNLPEKTFVLREVEMTGSQQKRFDEIREGLILRMRSTSGEEFVRDITNILEEYLRAVQVASNPRLIDPEWQGTPAKFLELDEIVNEVVRESDQKIVIWSNYLGNIRELRERYRDLGAEMFSGEVSAAERADIVRRFQEDDTTKVLVAVPAAGGVGITLTRAQTAVYIDKTWNAEHWMQSVDRIHRIGQTGTVTVISLLASKVDEMIHWNLRRKERNQAEVLGDKKKSSSSARLGLPSREELLQALER